MNFFSDKKVIGRHPIPGGLFPGDGMHLRMIRGNTKDKFAHLGIHTDDAIILDSAAKHRNGEPSCFWDPSTDTLWLRRYRKHGLKHIGKLVGTVDSDSRINIWENGRAIPTDVRL